MADGPGSGVPGGAVGEVGVRGEGAVAPAPHPAAVGRHGDQFAAAPAHPQIEVVREAVVGVAEERHVVDVGATAGQGRGQQGNQMRGMFPQGGMQGGGMMMMGGFGGGNGGGGGRRGGN